MPPRRPRARPGRRRSRPRRPGAGARRADRDAALLLRAPAGRQGHEHGDQGPAAHPARASSTAPCASRTSRATSARTRSCGCSPAAPWARSRCTSSPPTPAEKDSGLRGRLPLAGAAAARRPGSATASCATAAPATQPGDELCCPTAVAESRAALARAQHRARGRRAARGRPRRPWGDQLWPAAGRELARGEQQLALGAVAHDRERARRGRCARRPSAGAGRRRPRRARRRRRGSGPRRAGPRARPASRA